MWTIGNVGLKRRSLRRRGRCSDLSGPKLRRAFENLAESAESTGGIERYVGALALKASLFEEVLGKGRVSELTETGVLRSRPHSSPRCVGASARGSAETAFPPCVGASKRCCSAGRMFGRPTPASALSLRAFPADREHRWARDLAAEVLHFTAPDRYPLMTRWMWDARIEYRRLARDLARRRLSNAGDHSGRPTIFAHLRDAARGARGLLARQRRLPRSAVLCRSPVRACLCRLHQRHGRPISARGFLRRQQGRFDGAHASPARPRCCR